MGNTLFISDDTGTIIGSYAYTPYGELISSNGGLDNPFTWQGENGLMSEGNGLYYVRARYYDANTGRFISPDPVKSTDPRSINPYPYAYNNPKFYIDISGRKPRSRFTDQDKEDFADILVAFATQFTSGVFDAVELIKENERISPIREEEFNFTQGSSLELVGTNSNREANLKHDKASNKQLTTDNASPTTTCSNNPVASARKVLDDLILRLDRLEELIEFSSNKEATRSFYSEPLQRFREDVKNAKNNLEHAKNNAKLGFRPIFKDLPGVICLA